MKLRNHHMLALAILRDNPGDEVGVIDSNEKIAAAIVFSQLKNAGYIDGGFAAGSGGLRLIQLGEFTIAEQGTVQ